MPFKLFSTYVSKARFYDYLLYTSRPTCFGYVLFKIAELPPHFTCRLVFLSRLAAPCG